MAECTEGLILKLQAEHLRFIQQAEWTASLRDYVLTRFPPSKSIKILEVGSGTGAVMSSLPSCAKKYGIDINLERLTFSKNPDSTNLLASANGAQIPFPACSFDLTFCHYLLLWVKDPVEILREMRRVTQRGGILAAFAEPDYGISREESRISQQIHALQARSLKKQGANPFIGRRLADLFQTLHLKPMEAGRLTNQPRMSESGINLEIYTIYNDLQIATKQNIARALVNRYKKEIDSLHTMPYVATFFAFGTVN